MSSLDLERDQIDTEDEGIEYTFDDMSPSSASPHLNVIGDVPVLNGDLK